MKTDKERIAELTHVLNELYDAAYEYQCVAHFNYDTKESCAVALTFENALYKADKILEGN